MAKYELSEAILSYLEAVRSVKGLVNYACLNQEPDAEYTRLWESAQSDKKILSPYQVFFAGVENIYA